MSLMDPQTFPLLPFGMLFQFGELIFLFVEIVLRGKQEDKKAKEFVANRL